MSSGDSNLERHTASLFDGLDVCQVFPLANQPPPPHHPDFHAGNPTSDSPGGHLSYATCRIKKFTLNQVCFPGNMAGFLLEVAESGFNHFAGTSLRELPFLSN